MLVKAEGIVLKIIPYGETNVILRLYTREAGKVSVMARGARKPKSRFAAASQPFVHGIYLFYKSRGMSTLNQGDTIDAFRHIRSDIMKTAYASYIAELLDRVTEEREKNPFLFELFLQILQRMNEDSDPEVLTRIFEVKMLAQAGIKPQLDQCTSCGRQEGTFSFSVREGGFLCENCKEIDPYRLTIHPKSVQLLRTFFYLDIKRLGSISLTSRTKQELKQVLESYYEEYGGFSLKSKRFLDQMEKWDI
ncbi:DNA repair protein RecO [Alteribacillus iranensis]|uniref:DNA repair protein RecO n=1 Tax=Alteribacillus iranensis TaxID=930128 RepID=A0A1I1ZBN8_9BACI|nr:DNA repair protein RecO [Alteribacillus iranensis]SFE29085.1 DNA replication and repair protein RecO [Alteribacillus iranensis]